MGVLDAVMTEAGSHLGISSSSAGSVLASLLSLIGREESGISGFLDRFRRAGAGNLVSSWLSGDARPVTVDAVEHALGHDTIDQIGSKAGLSFSMAASAIALMLPRLIPRLAPAGVSPARFSADLMAAPIAPVRVSSEAPAAQARPGQTVLSRWVWSVLAAGTAVALLAWVLN
jgi:OmpA-OmpF porin, OOP family